MTVTMLTATMTIIMTITTIPVTTLQQKCQLHHCITPMTVTHTDNIKGNNDNNNANVNNDNHNDYNNNTCNYTGNKMLTPSLYLPITDLTLNVLL
jgi:hypothetical protein